MIALLIAVILVYFFIIIYVCFKLIVRLAVKLSYFYLSKTPLDWIRFFSILIYILGILRGTWGRATSLLTSGSALSLFRWEGTGTPSVPFIILIWKGDSFCFPILSFNPSHCFNYGAATAAVLLVACSETRSHNRFSFY